MRVIGTTFTDDKAIVTMGKLTDTLRILVELAKRPPQAAMRTRSLSLGRNTR
jgi:hypothetical protein